MTVIRLDMYEVQLGAAVLIQFDNDGDTVRVLSDAGIHAGGYARDHVHQKLKASFQGFDSNADDRIDLLMGSHYDKDHLDGLIDVASDPTIAITEAWLPPVEDDTDMDDGPDDSGGQARLSLGAKFARETGDAEFDRYIRSQLQRCQEAIEVRAQVVDAVKPQRRPRKVEVPEPYSERPGRHDVASWEFAEAYFEFNVRDAEEDLRVANRDWTEALRQADENVDDDDEGSDFEAIQPAFHRVGSTAPSAVTPLTIASLPAKDLMNDPSLASNVLTRTALVRKSAARNAINASSLKKLVDALRNRMIPIRFESISQGKPRYFVLDRHGVFLSESESNYRAANAPKLTLLGPSDALINKHRKLLPIYRATMALAEVIPIKGITPSNQLSYVAKFEYQGQKILISGDTGFVDFKPKGSRPYFQKLLDELDDLEIVQVAHHGGNNAHFYRVLQDAPFGSYQGATPYLLLSHGTHDRHRPSAVFGQFVANLASSGLVPEILFTSEPDPQKVQRFRHLVAPVVGSKGQVGDVRLEFDGIQWSVTAHAVVV